MSSSSRRAVRLLAAAAAACCACLAAGCGSVTTSTPPAAQATAAGADATASASSGSGSSGQGCATSALRGAIPATANAASGHYLYTLNLTNDSSASCTLYGYPGVSFVTSPGGSQIGTAATRATTTYIFQDQPPQTVTLAPGQTVHADLQLMSYGVYPAAQCDVVTAQWVRVYPPNQSAPLYVQLTVQTCSQGPSLLTVSPVQPAGSGTP
jgi:hypothetical protein